MKQLLKQTAYTFILVLAILYLLPSITVKAENKEPDMPNLTLKKGDSITLSIENQTDPVTWSSSNDKIASVTKDGKVTGKNAGVAIITATYNNGMYIYRITVKSPKISNITIGTDSFTAKSDGKIDTDIDMGSQSFTVYYKGKVCKDFSVSSTDDSICDISKKKNGTFTVKFLTGGQTKLKIKVGKETAKFDYNIVVRINLNYGPGVTKLDYMPTSKPVFMLSDEDCFGEDVNNKQFLAVVTVSGAASTKYTAKSSDSSICKVTKKKDGTLVIKPIKDGECDITIKAKDYTAQFHWKH